MNTCKHENQHGLGEPTPTPLDRPHGNFRLKTVRVWCDDCGKMIWKYEVYSDGTRLQWKEADL